MIKITKRISEIQYAIRDIVSAAKEYEKEGHRITYLSIGDPGKYGYDIPNHIKKAMIRAIKENINFYVDSEGIGNLRSAIADYENEKSGINLVEEDTLVTSGVSEGILFTFAGMLENNDEILLPGPSYPPYSSYAKFFGATPVEYKLDEEKAWQPDIDDIRKKINEKTRLILIISPNNPTGSIYNEKQIKEIINIAGEYEIPIMSDEIYDVLSYEEKVVNPASLTNDVPIIGLNGFSKAFFMTGWRLGYLYYHDPLEKIKDLSQNIARMARIRLCVNGPAQLAATAALKGDKNYLYDFRKGIEKKADFLYKRLNDIPLISAVKPKGAFYIFPKIDLNDYWKDDKEFTLDFLKEEKVLFVYGSGFGEKFGKNHVRIVFLADYKTLDDAMNKLEHFIYKKIK
ncbi:MAG: aminotransferase class I/II-fold pyridoxal phosphate-dependent enzyme [Candidatus Lokiarchaeota archaeon]|nr:aminotransferase class I/II-fold pyridoxal phosphate-dependent enzyme [Candidatus Lokiarchaeota archaeon]